MTAEAVAGVLQKEVELATIDVWSSMKRQRNRVPYARGNEV